MKVEGDVLAQVQKSILTPPPMARCTWLRASVESAGVDDNVPPAVFIFIIRVVTEDTPGRQALGRVWKEKNHKLSRNAPAV